MFKRILVGVDGSTHSHRALRAAIDLAARYGSHLTLATVMPPHLEPEAVAMENLIPRGEEQKTLSTQLEEAQAESRARGVPSVEAVLLRGKVVEAMLDYLAGGPQDLVVVGSRGLSAGGRLLIGSVSSSLVDRAPCPVLVVRPVARKHRPSPA